MAIFPPPRTMQIFCNKKINFSNPSFKCTEFFLMQIAVKMRQREKNGICSEPLLLRRTFNKVKKYLFFARITAVNYAEAIRCLPTPLIQYAQTNEVKVYLPRPCTNFVRTIFVLTNFVITYFVLTAFVLTAFVLTTFVLTAFFSKNFLFKLFLFERFLLERLLL
jgi:hypothetical protein